MSLLGKKLDNWDGKSTDDLRHIYASIEVLISILPNDKIHR